MLGFSASTAFSNAFVAANEGIFKKHGLDVEMKLVPNSSTTPAALIADSLQVATPTAPITLQAIEQGLDLVVLAGGSYYAKGIEDVAIMVRPNSPIKTAKDFEGKRVATAGLNAFLHVLFRKWMSGERRRLQEGDLHRDAVRAADRRAALRPGRRHPGGAAVPGARARDQCRPRRRLLHRGARGRDARRLVRGDAQMGAGEPEGRGRVRRRDRRGDRARAEGQTRSMRKANLVYIPFPAEVQAKFPDARYRAVVAPEAVEKWNKIALEQAMLKKPVDPAKILYRP